MSVEVFMHGGYSYAAPDEVEVFESWIEAKYEYRRRMESWNTYYPMWGDYDDMDTPVISDIHDNYLTLAEVVLDDDQAVDINPLLLT